MSPSLFLSPSQVYQRKQKLWRAYCQWAERIRRAFFPDTGGVSLYLHNWHKCQREDPKRAALAEWVDDSTYARYKRAEAKLRRFAVAREHKHGRHGVKLPGWDRAFDPFWCPICHPECAKSYGYVLKAGHWVKENDCE